MSPQQPHAGNVIGRPGLQRKTSRGHAALDIRDGKISQESTGPGLSKPRRQHQTSSRICCHGGRRIFCYGQEPQRQEGILVATRIPQTVSRIDKWKTSGTNFHVDHPSRIPIARIASNPTLADASEDDFRPLEDGRANPSASLDYRWAGSNNSIGFPSGSSN